MKHKKYLDMKLRPQLHIGNAFLNRFIMNDLFYFFSKPWNNEVIIIEISINF